MNITVEQLIWTTVGFVLSVMVFSYLIGDNPLFRFAVHLLIGVGAGYLVVITVFQVLYPRLVIPLFTGTTLTRSLTVIPIVLSVLLLMRLSRRLSPAGNLPIAFLVGVGTAVIIGGAILGTLIPQTAATFRLFLPNPSSTSPMGRLLEGLFILFGTITTLGMFFYGTQPASMKVLPMPVWQRILTRIGQTFLMITLGALFAGLYIAALTALVDRVRAIWDLFKGLLG